MTCPHHSYTYDHGRGYKMCKYCGDVKSERDLRRMARAEARARRRAASHAARAKHRRRRNALLVVTLTAIGAMDIMAFLVIQGSLHILDADLVALDMEDTTQKVGAVQDAVTPPPRPPTVSATPAVGLTLDDLKAQMLDMINDHRSRAGLGNVTLGNNTAAQHHAEDMKQNCYLSHWNLNGTKPNMRYVVAGGHQYNAENVAGHERCYGSGYATESAESQLWQHMNGLMSSPGHRSNILDPHHAAVNLGIAYDSRSMWAVQQFEYGYVEFTDVPNLDGGMLSFAGHTKNGAAFHASEDMGITIYYSPYPRDYARSELNRTTCYDAGRPVALIREAAPPGYYYLEYTATMPGSPCPNPDAATSSGMIRPPVFSHIVGWHDADVWRASGESFELSVDIGSVIDEFGAGVYTAFVWAAGDAPIASYPILYEGRDAP